jgi:hypothetical protein
VGLVKRVRGGLLAEIDLAIAAARAKQWDAVRWMAASGTRNWKSQ